MVVALDDALWSALRLLATRDPVVLSAVGVSLRVSLLATLASVVLGGPIGFLVASRSFRGRATVEVMLRTLTALPTVVVGVLTYAILSRSGPLGGLGLLYTPAAMVLGETVLATPLMAVLTMAAIGAADPRIEETALTLGASPLRSAFTVLDEMRLGMLAAVVTGFGRLVSELGVALMVGGNIRGATRTMTTAIALETSKGEFAMGLALGLVLLAIALVVNVGAAVLTPAR